MSEFKKTRDVSTYQKLSPPKSLQGEDDAEVTWDLIVKRYPNAAPLLCQMETVIERAEGLLQQLRSPCAQDPERSSSFQVADSEDELMGPCHVEESTEVSMTSEQDSRVPSAENMTPEIVSVAGCSLSDKISDDYQDGKSASEQVCSIGDGRSEILEAEVSVGEGGWSPDVSSSSIYEADSKNPPAPESEIQGNPGQEESLKSNASSIVNVTEAPTSSNKLLEERGVGKSSSLEAWGKVVGEDANRCKNFKSVESTENSSGVIDSKEDSVSEHARRLSVFKTGPVQQIAKLNFLGKKDELAQRFAGTIATASKYAQGAVNHVEPVAADGTEAPKDAGEIEPAETKINELGERERNSSGNIAEEPDEKRDGLPSASMKDSRANAECNEAQGNGDEGVATPGAGPRSPVEMLDEYSKICGLPVEYKNLNPSCSYNKSVIVKCCFAGFAFDACAQGKKTAKKDAAAKLLRCLAGRQIDGENMAELTPFTRRQIEEIIGLGNGGDNETAVRKLYKMCVELNAPEPVYTVHQDSGIVGNRYTVKCGALGITTSGYGIRVLVAKRVAADKLLHNYHENRDAAN